MAERLNIKREVRIAYCDTLAKDEAVRLAVEQEQLAKDVLDTVIQTGAGGGTGDSTEQGRKWLMSRVLSRASGKNMN